MNVFLNNPDAALQFAKLTRSEDIARAQDRCDVKEARRARLVEDDSTAAPPHRTRFVLAVLRAVRPMNIL